MATACARCRRPLSAPESVERGLGPICARKEKEQHKIMETDQFIDIPEDPTVAIVCRRCHGCPACPTMSHRHFNFPQRVVRHSPTGMEWGYGGSGPADFAINALLAAGVPEDVATNPSVYQEFKWAFVCDLPSEGGSIATFDVLAWLDGHYIGWTNGPGRSG